MAYDDKKEKWANEAVATDLFMLRLRSAEFIGLPNSMVIGGNVMDKKFFCQWFKGFENGLNEMDSDSRSCLLKHCARHCAETGVLQSYRKLYQTVNGNRDEFYSRLSEIGNVRGEVVVPDKEYFIYFPECACDIHTAGGVNSPDLCECSRQSIIYVGESIWNESKLYVEQIETVLSGDAECKFRIRFE